MIMAPDAMSVSLTGAVSDTGIGFAACAPIGWSRLPCCCRRAAARPAARLAAELEVSVRTVYRDIAALNSAGVPVVTESGPGGGCWLLDGYRFPLRGLSGDEAAALLVLGVPAAVAELGLADALAAAQRKIRLTAGGGADRGAGGGTGGGADGGPAPALVHLDMPRWFGGTEPVPWLRTLAAAVRDRQQLRLGYRHGNQDETTRVICPLGLVNKAGTWYLVAVGGTRAAGGDGAGGSARQAETGPPTATRWCSASGASRRRSRWLSHLPGRRASTWRRSGAVGRPRS